MSTCVDSVFAFKALSYSLVGLLAIKVLALSLISLRRDIHSGRPLTGLVRFALVIAVFCVLVALYTAYVRLPMSISASRHEGELVTWIQPMRAPISSAARGAQ